VNVAQLKQKLDEVNGDAIVVIPAFDHSYSIVHASEVTTAIADSKLRPWIISEDHGMDLEDGEHRIDVLVIG